MPPVNVRANAGGGIRFKGCPAKHNMPERKPCRSYRLLGSFHAKFAKSQPLFVTRWSDKSMDFWRENGHASEHLPNLVARDNRLRAALRFGQEGG